MLFHSYEFLFGFLPACFLGFILIQRLWGAEKALLWLIAASLYFYAHWGLLQVGLLAGSVLVNYALARLIAARTETRAAALSLLLIGVAANLTLLGYFKYMNFFIDNVNAMTGSSLSHMHILLPVGISFYSFIQIGFLIEVYNRQVHDFSLRHYALFATFFPYITAGPIVLQKDIMTQLNDDRRALVDPMRIAVALTVFGMGLFKKLVLADSIAPYADAVFNGVADGGAVSAGMAWIGALAYTLQLYFDFSGYSDMALGLGFLFGIKLPLNFNSPLKADSIIDFWRRWHMTMTRFFTNYVFSPIAVSMMRRSLLRRYSHVHRFAVATALPVILTMTIAGLWHGAGWTFVIFGLIHGVALAINNGWREARLKALPQPAGWLLTMTVVVVGLVFFRAQDVPVAVTLLACMTGLESWLAAPTGAFAVLVDTAPAVGLILLLGMIALISPNTQELMRRYWYSSDAPSEADEDAEPRLAWRPSLGWAAATAVVLCVSIGLISGDTTFLYYDF